jgi:hypothetical protein
MQISRQHGDLPEGAQLASSRKDSMLVPESPLRVLRAMAETDPPRQPLERVEDAMREIGTLLLAFTPAGANVLPRRSAHGTEAVA